MTSLDPEVEPGAVCAIGGRDDGTLRVCCSAHQQVLCAHHYARTHFVETMEEYHQPGCNPQPKAYDTTLFEPPPAAEKPPPEPMIVKGRIKISMSFEVDMVTLVRDHADEYAAFDLERGYMPWERPAVFLHEQVAEALELYLGGTVKDTTHPLDEPEIEFTWTEADSHELMRRLA